MPWPKGKHYSKEHITKRTASFHLSGGNKKKPRIINEVEYWKCPKCKKWLPADEYHKDKKSANGLKSYCKNCHQRISIKTRNPKTYRATKRRSEAIRRARKANSKIIQFTKKDEEKLKVILGKECLKCSNKNELQFDHIKPLAKGGIHHPVNIQILCRKCNEIKQAREVDYRNEEQIGKIEKVWRIEFKEATNG